MTGPKAPPDVQTMIDYYDIPPMAVNETEEQIRDRVAVWLRGHGKLIEAQEIAQGKRYDAPGGETVLAGVAGAIVSEMGGAPPFVVKGSRRALDDEVVIGYLASAPPDPAREAMEKAVELLGPDVAMKFLLGP